MKNKKILFLTCAVIVLPVLVGLLLWNKLPAEMAIHFNISGQPDNFVPKLWAVLLIPAFCLVMQLVCVYFAGRDMSYIHSKWGEKIVFWIVPVICVVVCTFLYSYSLGVQINIATWVLTFCSILFLILGNIMPKSSRNAFFGAKVPWAYKSEAAWKLTQRITGWGMVLGSIATLIVTWCGFPDIAIFVLLAFAFGSLLWSWVACRNMPKEA